MQVAGVWGGYPCLAAVSRTAAVLACLVVGGCVSLAPPELVQARTTYDRAARGGLAWRSPAALGLARRSLAEAEATFFYEGNTELVRDQAYIALRKAELAEIEASMRMLAQRMMTLHDRQTALREQPLATVKTP